MAKESTSGLGVYNVYGPRTTNESRLGKLPGAGYEHELQIDITGSNHLELTGNLPAGAVITRVDIYVSEAFVVTGTSPTLLIGTDGSEATNGFVVSEAVLEATGHANLTSTLAGTWDAEADLAAATTIGAALGGTSPAIAAGSGVARIVIKYLKV